MRKLAALLTAVSIAIVAATGCGGEETQAASAATELVPAGAAVYAEATIDPEGDQQQALDALLAKFPGGDQLLGKLRQEIEQSLRESSEGLSYSEDIEPWLGDEAAVYVGAVELGAEDVDAVVLIASEDDEQAEAALEKTAEGELRRKTHNDVEYMVDDENAAVVTDGFVAIGPEESVKGVIDTAQGGDSLAADDVYNDAVDGVAEERLALFYLNMPELRDDIASGGVPLPEGVDRFFKEPLVFTVAAEEDGVLLEGLVSKEVGGAFFGEGSDLLEELPADAWLATAAVDSGELVNISLSTLGEDAPSRETIERQFRAATGLDLDKDVLSWMGDFAAFARGSSIAELDGALIVETDDEAATGRVIAALERLATGAATGAGVRVTPLTAPGGGDGFSVASPQVPQPIHVFQRDGRFVLAYGDAAASDATDAAQRLGDTTEYSSARDALGDYDPSLFLLLEPVFSLLDSTPLSWSEGWQEAKPYLAPLRAVIGGTAEEGDDVRSATKFIVK